MNSQKVLHLMERKRKLYLLLKHEPYQLTRTEMKKAIAKLNREIAKEMKKPWP